jgi:hypothetical protein
MFKSKPVLGLGKAGLLPARRSTGTTGPSKNTAPGTDDVNAPFQEQRERSIVTDSHFPHPGPSANANNHYNLSPHNLRRNINHAAASVVIGAAKESEIITIGSPQYQDKDEGIGAASAEPLLDIEETSLEKTAAGPLTKQQPSGLYRRRTRENGDITTIDNVEEDDNELDKEASLQTRRIGGGRTKRSTAPATRDNNGEEEILDERERKRIKNTSTTTTKRTKAAGTKISELIGQVVHVPGSVFFVDHPEYYIGDIKRKDSRRRNAVEVRFRDDNSTYWFPVKDVVNWIEEKRAREQVKVILEEEEGDVQKEAPATAGAFLENNQTVLPHSGSVKDLNEIDRKASMYDEELAAQALTDISAGAGGGGLSATVSRSGGGLGGSGGGGVSSVERGEKTGDISDSVRNARAPSRLRIVAS